jgi:hypothetical protein
MNVNFNSFSVADLLAAISRTAVPERRFPSRSQRKKVEDAAKAACEGLTIPQLKDAIGVGAEGADDIRVFSARLLWKLRGLIEAGSAGPNVKWTEWAMQNLGQHGSRLRELQRIGRAKDPWHELDRLRRMADARKDRMAKRRESDEQTALRERVIVFAKTGHIDNVKKIDVQIAHLPAARR